MPGFLLCYQCFPVLSMFSCVIVCYCVFLCVMAAAQLHSMPLTSCYPVLLCIIRVGSSSTVTYHASDIVLSMLFCVFMRYQGWQQHSYIPCLLYCVINVILCYRVLLCVLCVIRVGSSSTVTYHASDIVLSCVIVCYSVLSGLTTAALLHTVPLISCY